jgi:hypothetical protein
MTLTLELTPAEEARLSAAARARGQDPEAFLRAIIDTLPETEDPTLALRKEREAAWARIQQRLAEQAPSDGTDSLRYLREARAGAMFGYEPTEEEVTG